MKMKKSELLALIKEEIMKEAPFGRGMTMMDDPYDDNEPQPASMQTGGAMDQAFQYILTDVEKSLDFPAGALVNYLVTQNPEASPDAVGSMAVQVLETLGMNFPTERAVEQYISREMDDREADMMQEGLEGINAENIGLVFEAMSKMAPMIAMMGVPAFLGLLKEFYDERKQKQDQGGAM